MKKLILSTLSVVVIAAAISSCGKSSKGKMSNDWKIESYDRTSTEVDSDGDKTVTTEVYNGSSITQTVSSTTNGFTTTQTQTATMTDPTFKIEKDGTWSTSKTMVFVQDTPNPGIKNTTTSTLTESGTWSFVGKNKDEDFKKNERVLFNTLNSSQTSSTTTTGSSIATSYSSSDTYKTGELVQIYTVAESKKKALELTSEEANSSTYGSNTSSNSMKSSMKLVQE